MTVETTLKRRIAELEDQVKRLSFAARFGCLTREGLNEALRSIDLVNGDFTLVYFDVDNLKQANEQWGKDVVNGKIKSAIMSRFDDILCGQWFSGDEFLALVPSSDARGYAQRLLESFYRKGMSATFVIELCDPGISLDDQVSKLELKATQLKQIGSKGIVYDFSLEGA